MRYQYLYIKDIKVKQKQKQKQIKILRQIQLDKYMNCKINRQIDRQDKIIFNKYVNKTNRLFDESVISYITFQ